MKTKEEKLIRQNMQWRVSVLDKARLASLVNQAIEMSGMKKTDFERAFKVNPTQTLEILRQERDSYAKITMLRLSRAISPVTIAEVANVGGIDRWREEYHWYLDNMPMVERSMKKDSQKLTSQKKKKRRGTKHRLPVEMKPLDPALNGDRGGIVKPIHEIAPVFEGNEELTYTPVEEPKENTQGMLVKMLMQDIRALQREVKFLRDQITNQKTWNVNTLREVRSNREDITILYRKKKNKLFS